MDEPFQRTILTLLEKQVASRGEQAIRDSQEALLKMLKGEEIQLGSLTDDLVLASDILASMEVMESARKHKIREWLVGIVQETLGVLGHV